MFGTLLHWFVSQKLGTPALNVCPESRCTCAQRQVRKELGFSAHRREARRCFKEFGGLQHQFFPFVSLFHRVFVWFILTNFRADMDFFVAFRRKGSKPTARSEPLAGRTALHLASEHGQHRAARGPSAGASFRALGSGSGSMVFNLIAIEERNFLDFNFLVELKGFSTKPQKS